LKKRKVENGEGSPEGDRTRNSHDIFEGRKIREHSVGFLKRVAISKLRNARHPEEVPKELGGVGLRDMVGRSCLLAVIELRSAFT